jgi:hypothetical protein
MALDLASGSGIKGEMRENGQIAKTGEGVFDFINTFIIAGVLLLSGCGYTLQNSRSPLTEKEGIRKIYISPLVNNTFRVGVENVVFNALQKSISVHRRVLLVSSRQDADAVLTGSVDAVVSTMSAGQAPAAMLGGSVIPDPHAQGFSTNSLGGPYANQSIASEYTATLVCSFALNRLATPPGKKTLLWTASFSRTTFYPGANQLGAYGTTSALINDSEFDRAISTDARGMTDDVHESMLAMF